MIRGKASGLASISNVCAAYFKIQKWEEGGKERKYDSWCQAIIATWKEHVDEDDYLSACLLSEVSVSEFKMRTLTLPQPPPQLPLLDFSFLCLLSLIWRTPQPCMPHQRELSMFLWRRESIGLTQSLGRKFQSGRQCR